METASTYRADAPAFSVVMPLFEKVATVPRAVASVLSQTVGSFELIVVDDGSTDRGPELVRAIPDPRIRVVAQQNAGAAAARNLGVAHATAEVVAFLDADDEWEPDFLEAILRLRHAWPRAGVWATSYWHRTPSRKRRAIVAGLPPGFQSGVLPDYFRVAARSDPPVWSSAVAVAKATLAEVGGFPPGVSSGEDLLTWARLAARSDVAYCVEPKAHFWSPVEVGRRVPRTPQDPDVVGAALSRLARENASGRTRSMPEYVALWHRMRAVVYCRLGELRRARAELQMAMALAPTVKLCALYVLAMLPPRVARAMYDGLRAVRRARAA